MKLSFSINGWRDTTWEEFCDIAKETGFFGRESHDIKKEGL